MESRVEKKEVGVQGAQQEYAEQEFPCLAAGERAQERIPGEEPEQSGAEDAIQ